MSHPLRSTFICVVDRLGTDRRIMNTCSTACARRAGKADSMTANNPTGRMQDRRTLIAVVYADMVGYSRLIGLDDVGKLERLRPLRRTLIDPSIAARGGRIVNTGGDSLLIVFDSVDGAMRF